MWWVLRGISCRDGAGTEGRRPGSSRGENEEVSSVGGQRYRVECLETRPGRRKVGTAVGADPSLSRLSVHTTHVLSTYRVLGPISHPEPVDESDGK